MQNPKSRSRLYAVQCFYAKQLDAETNYNAVLEALAIAEKKGRSKIIRHSKDILDFAEKEISSLNFIITNYSEKTKDVSKINPLVYSIIIVALAEMLKFEGVEKPIIISEFIAIAGDFFDKSEVSFINAVLDKFSKNSK
jgi:N utilization substance protein B